MNRLQQQEGAGAGLPPRQHDRVRPPQHRQNYGSVGDALSPVSMTSTASCAASELDSLVGEGLIHTDSEADTPKNVGMSREVNGGVAREKYEKRQRDRDDASEGSRSSKSQIYTKDKGTVGGFVHGACSDWLLNVRGRHPVGHVTRVVLVMIIVCVCTLVWVMSPPRTGSATAGSQSGSGSGGTHLFEIPFPNVDRAVFGDPVSGIISPDLFHPTLLHKPISAHVGHGRSGAGNSATGEAASTPEPFLNVPFPTGAFWVNLVLKPTADRGISYPIVTYPYAYKWSPTMLQASYPPLRRRVDSISVRDTFNPDLTFDSREAVSKRHILKFDPLSVTVRFYADNGGHWDSYLVQGSPYITIEYENVTPVLTPLSIFTNFFCPRDEDGNYNDGGTGGGQASSSHERRSVLWGVCGEVDGHKDGATAAGVTLQGVQFLLQTQENLTWMVFASEPITLTFDTITKRTVASVGKFTGVLRLALIPPPLGQGVKSGISSASTAEAPSGVPLSTSSGVQRLIYHSRVYPVGGKVAWDFRSSSSGTSSLLSVLANKKVITGDASSSRTRRYGSIPSEKVATIRFHYDTKTMTDNANSSPNAQHDELLLLSLPHHAQLLQSDAMLQSKQFDLVYHCIKGAMTPVVGDSWSYEEQLTSIGFDDFDASTDGLANPLRGVEMDFGVKSTILDQVEKDLTRVLPTPDENVYGFGKQVARLAQLAHIADKISQMPEEVGDEGQDDDEVDSEEDNEDPSLAITEKAMSLLHSFLEGFLLNDNRDKLLYDGNLGGLVTRDGLLNSEADFGNGRYNDHHFHYGYVLYACALLGNWNSTFVSEYGPYVDSILYDVAHYSNSDSKNADRFFFPMARHKAWFDGHSFASGLFPFGNGKSQESSSEAVNCYYGAYLWSMVRWGGYDEGDGEKNKRVDFARLLLATEIRGAKTYWHMIPPGNKTVGDDVPSIYNPTLAQNYMIGNLGMLDAVCSTWFGTQALYVHMINFVPVTAVTAELFDEDYVQEEFGNVIGPLLPNVEMPWRGYVVSDHAIIDPSAAWTEALELVSYELDSALSKSQVLYWASTRSGFSLHGAVSPPDSSNRRQTLHLRKLDRHRVQKALREGALG